VGKHGSGGEGLEGVKWVEGVEREWRGRGGSTLLLSHRIK
jgi:hypothetical protein